jgi:hypothetical protein
MTCQQLGLGRLEVRKAHLDHACNLCMQLLSVALKQRVVSCVLYQRVLEGVDLTNPLIFLYQV